MRDRIRTRFDHAAGWQYIGHDSSEGQHEAAHTASRDEHDSTFIESTNPPWQIDPALCSLLSPQYPVAAHGDSSRQLENRIHSIGRTCWMTNVFQRGRGGCEGGDDLAMGPPPAVLFMGGGACGPQGRQRRRRKSLTNTLTTTAGTPGLDQHVLRLERIIQTRALTQSSPVRSLPILPCLAETERTRIAGLHPHTFHSPLPLVTRHAELFSSLSVSSHLPCPTLLFGKYPVPERVPHKRR
jgi:hypothetical protein